MLTLEVTLTGRKYTDAASLAETYRRLWERLHALPGVTAAGGVTSLPLSQMFAWGPITVEGRTPPAGEEFINADMRMVGGAYFKAMEIPLVKGRWFDERDTPSNPRVTIVDERMANDLWPGEDPIGKRLRTGGLTSTTPWITVIGVAGRVKQYTLDGDSRIAMYLPETQFARRAMNVVLRSESSPAVLTAGVRSVIRELDPDLPIYNVRTMADRVDESLAERRFAMQLLTLFAAVALGLATIGIYGVIAYLVSQGTRELGIRLALGATPTAVVWLVARHTVVIAVVGVTSGVLLAFALTRFMQSLLFNVHPADPVTFATIAAGLCGGRARRRLHSGAPRWPHRSRRVAAQFLSGTGRNRKEAWVAGSHAVSMSRQALFLRIDFRDANSFDVGTHRCRSAGTGDFWRRRCRRKASIRIRSSTCGCRASRRSASSCPTRTRRRRARLARLLEAVHRARALRAQAPGGESQVARVAADVDKANVRSRSTPKPVARSWRPIRCTTTSSSISKAHTTAPPSRRSPTGCARPQPVRERA